MKLKSILFLATIPFSTMVFAQQPYFLETVQEPYADLQGATVLTDGIVWDDPEIPVALPFQFTIGGNTLDSIYIFDGGLSSDNTFLDIDAANENRTDLSAILAIGSDLIDRAVHDGGGSVSPISYKTITENGKEIFVIEFKNAGFYDEDIIFGPSQDFVNLQIRLVDDNSIEFHFGENNISNPSDYFYDNDGSIVALVPNYDIDSIGYVTFNQDVHALTNDPANPDLELVNIDWEVTEVFPSLDAYPENGTKYVFSLNNPSIGQNELDNSGISIVNPIEQTLIYSNNQNNVDFIEIVDLQGKVVLSTSVIENIDVSALKAGMYMVKFYKGNKTQSIQKMVKS